MTWLVWRQYRTQGRDRIGTARRGRRAFEPGHFYTQGIVPVGYAVFAMALGGFIGLRLVISAFLQQHYMAAVTTYYNVMGSVAPSGQAWVLAHGAVSPTGQFVSTGWGELYPALPAACQRVLNEGQNTPSKSGNGLSAVFSCMQENTAGVESSPISHPAATGLPGY
jgi:hypothetical protein